MKTTKPAKSKQPFFGTVTRQGVSIRWNSNERMGRDESGDWESRGGDHITISATEAPLEDVVFATAQAARLRWARRRVVYICPGMNYAVSAVGLDNDDNLGILAQVQLHGEYLPVALASHHVAINPANYSKSGPQAMVEMGFLRDICRAFTRAENAQQMNEMIDAAYDAATSIDLPTALPEGHPAIAK